MNELVSERRLAETIEWLGTVERAMSKSIVILSPSTGGLAAPVHVHRREDEFSFVLEGRWGFQLGSDVVYAEPGVLVYKPRDVWHTFWNATDEPARLLEIISPAGFEQLFVELAGPAEDRPRQPRGRCGLGTKVRRRERPRGDRAGRPPSMA